jgi:hypothetical protein
VGGVSGRRCTGRWFGGDGGVRAGCEVYVFAWTRELRHSGGSLVKGRGEAEGFVTRALRAAQQRGLRRAQRCIVDGPRGEGQSEFERPDTFNDKQSQIAERKTGTRRGPGNHSREAVSTRSMNFLFVKRFGELPAGSRVGRPPPAHCCFDARTHDSSHITPRARRLERPWVLLRIHRVARFPGLTPCSVSEVRVRRRCSEGCRHERRTPARA